MHVNTIPIAFVIAAAAAAAISCSQEIDLHHEDHREVDDGYRAASSITVLSAACKWKHFTDDGTRAVALCATNESVVAGGCHSQSGSVTGWNFFENGDHTDTPEQGELLTDLDGTTGVACRRTSSAAEVTANVLCCSEYDDIWYPPQGCQIVQETYSGGGGIFINCPEGHDAVVGGCESADSPLTSSMPFENGTPFDPMEWGDSIMSSSGWYCAREGQSGTFEITALCCNPQAQSQGMGGVGGSTVTCDCPGSGCCDHGGGVQGGIP